MIRDRVVIIGGGIAGLTAAVELVDQGLDVTVIEASDHCGGRLASWRKNGELFEHGLHVFSMSDHNLENLAKRIGVGPGAFRSLPRPSLKQRAPRGEVIGRQSVGRVVLTATRLAAAWLADELSMLRFRRAVTTFEPKRDFSGLDTYTFRSWLWRMGVNRRLYDTFFEPFVREHFGEGAARISAAAALSAYQGSSMRGARLRVQTFSDDPTRLLIEPLIRHIVARGGRVVTETAVRRLNIDMSGRAVAVETSRPIHQGTKQEPTGVDALARVDLTRVPKSGTLTVPSEYGGDIVISRHQGQFRAERRADAAQHTQGAQAATPLHADISGESVVVRASATPSFGAPIAQVQVGDVPNQGMVEVSGRVPLMIGRVGGNVVALSARCTHLDYQLKWDAQARQLVCDNHGSRFSSEGKVVTGPATRNLAHYPTRVEGGAIIVGASARNAPIFEAEHFIVATDIPAARQLLSERLREYPFFRNLDALQTVPMLVVRLWFGGARKLGDRMAGYLNGQHFHSFFVVSNIYASLQDGPDTVIELRAHPRRDLLALADVQVTEEAVREIREAFPDLPEAAQLVDIRRERSAISFPAAGLEVMCPDTRTPLPNLYLAGDWVGRRSQSWNVERAVASGLNAANMVIADTGGVGSSPSSRVEPGTRSGRAPMQDSPAPSRLRPTGRGQDHRWRASPVEWRSVILFGVVKFGGSANEQVVLGRFRQVAGEVGVELGRGRVVAHGDFSFDLESLDTGIPLRDYNVRIGFLDTPRLPTARFRLVEARAPVDLRSLSASEATACCRGTLTLNGHVKDLSFRAGVRLKSGLLDVRSVEDVELVPSEFGLDVERLVDRCRAPIEDRVRLAFRLAVPWRLCRRHLVATPAQDGDHGAGM